MKVSEAIERLGGMPQDAEFVVCVTRRDGNSVTVGEDVYGDADMEIWHNRGHGGCGERVEVSVTLDGCEG